jgi:hypothetical protein
VAIALGELPCARHSPGQACRQVEPSNIPYTHDPGRSWHPPFASWAEVPCACTPISLACSFWMSSVGAGASRCVSSNRSSSAVRCVPPSPRTDGLAGAAGGSGAAAPLPRTRGRRAVSTTPRRSLRLAIHAALVSRHASGNDRNGTYVPPICYRNHFRNTSDVIRPACRVTAVGLHVAQGPCASIRSYAAHSSCPSGGA